MSTLAGGLVGARLGYLLSPENDNNTLVDIIVTGAALGTIAGYALPYLGLDTRPRASARGVPATSFQIMPSLTNQQRGLAVVGSY